MFRFIDSAYSRWPESFPGYNPLQPRKRHTVSEPTQTATRELGDHRTNPGLGLVIAHHSAARFVGSVTPVPAHGTLVLGREGGGFSPGTMEDSQISRHHVTVQTKGKTLVLKDLESRNGTTVNGNNISECTLDEGDVIGLGRILLLVIRLDPSRLRQPHPRLVGKSAALGRAIHLIERVGPHDLPVLILGETGVGKELLAAEVHAHSGRRGRCVFVNCATLPDELIQSELFGHVRGAFSGANQNRRGLVEESRGGTLVLDEIGESSPKLQANLLRLLQEKEARPVGADQAHQVDVRFVSSTNRDLPQRVQAGHFREDLYARLNRCVVRMPPLRERREDILPLALHFAQQIAQAPVSLGAPLAQILLQGDWPGNARALQSIVDRIVIEQGTDQPLPVTDWLVDELALLPRCTPAPSSPPTKQPTRSNRPTKQEVIQVLETHDGHITATAQALGIGRNTLYRWLKKWDIDPTSKRS